jgi:hypothetical protein
MFLLFALCLQIQAEGFQKPEDPPPQPPVALERIRRGLERPPLDPIEAAGDRDVPVFRVYIREKPLPARRPWTEDTLHPVFVHTHFPLDHHEFLSTVTPEEFRSGTLYPIGLDVLPIIEGAIKGIRHVLRERAEAQARRVVQEELQMLLDARAQEKNR